MPSHALPRGPEARARRRAARRRRARATAPVSAGMGSALVIVDPLLSRLHGGPLTVAAGIVELGVLAGLIGAPIMVAAVAVDGLAQKLAARRRSPRPRWQYLLLACLCAAAAMAGVLVGMRFRNGLPVSAAGVGFTWSAAAALAMLGRAVCWGRVRRVFWWHRPQWLLAPPASPGDPAN